MTSTKYRAIVGLRYPATPDDVRKKKMGQDPIVWTNREPGDVCDDIPPESVKRLLAEGAIKEVVPKVAKPKKSEEVTDG